MLHTISPYVFALVCTWPDRIALSYVAAPLVEAALASVLKLVQR